MPTWAYTQGQRPWPAWQSPTRDTAGPWQAEGCGGPGAREMACQVQGEGPRCPHCPVLCGAEGLDSRGPAGVTHGRSQSLAQPRQGAQGQPTCPRRNPRGPAQTSAPRPWGARGGAGGLHFEERLGRLSPGEEFAQGASTGRLIGIRPQSRAVLSPREQETESPGSPTALPR